MTCWVRLCLMQMRSGVRSDLCSRILSDGQFRTCVTVGPVLTQFLPGSCWHTFLVVLPKSVWQSLWVMILSFLVVVVIRRMTVSIRAWLLVCSILVMR